MKQSLEWRLARTFVRCYSLVLIISLVQALFGPIFALLTTNYANGQEELWMMRAVAISSLVVWLAAIAILWFYSNKIADKVAGTSDSTIEGERLDFPLDVGVGVAGLIFLVEGLKGLAGEAAAWYFSKSNAFPYSRPAGVVDARQLAVSATEAIIGLVLFVGAKSLMQRISRMRGMPQSTEDKALPDNGFAPTAPKVVVNTYEARTRN